MKKAESCFSVCYLQNLDDQLVMHNIHQMLKKLNQIVLNVTSNCAFCNYKYLGKQLLALFHNCRDCFFRIQSNLYTSTAISEIGHYR